MLKQILALTNHLVPSYLAAKGLERLNPRLKDFITGASAAGFATDQIIDYIREESESPGQRGEKARLERGRAQGTLRPDERAAQTQIAQAELPGAVAQKGVALGAGLLTGGLGDIGAQAVQGMNAGPSPQQPPQQGMASPPQPQPNPQGQNPKGWQSVQGGAVLGGNPNPQGQGSGQQKQGGNIDQAIQMLDKSAAGQFVKKNLAAGSDPMALAAQVGGKMTQLAQQLEQVAGTDIGSIIEAYAQKLGAGQQGQQQGQQQASPGMDKIMQALSAATQSRQRRQRP